MPVLFQEQFETCFRGGSTYQAIFEVMKKLLIATPIFDGTVFIQYFHSMLATIPMLIQERIEFNIINEARNLINQARNRSVHFALNNGYDKILFIDADISWKASDVWALWNSDKKVVGGTYPLKTFPIKLNFVPPQGIYPKEVETFDPNEFVQNHSDPKTGEAEVFMLPTGFMMVDCSVFRELEPVVEKYHHRDQMKREIEEESMFFPFKIAPDGFLYTEDWGFCDEVHKLGHKIYWNTRVIVDHVGRHTFSATTPIEKSAHRIDIHAKNAKVSDLGIKNPFAAWPRNLQCFCGSGKKFKKCHEGQLDKPISLEEANQLKPDFDKVLAEVQSLHDQGIGYKLPEPQL